MKTFWKILGGFLGLVILLAIGLNIYFTDDRLKSTVMPYLDEATGREVSVESMSLTFFSTFPQPGLSITKMRIPGEAEGDTLASLEELVVGVELFSLLGDEVSISEIKLNRPRFTYVVNDDSTTNIDFLMSDGEEDTTAGGYAVNIPYFEISNGSFGYIDRTSATSVDLNSFNANISLRYADLIESDVKLNLGGLSATVGGNRFVNGLPLSLTESSTIDLANETVNIKEGTLSIRGLALNLSGSISNWSDTASADLSFNSSSDNFGELLRLVPAGYEEYIEGLETRGSLAIRGSVKGNLAGEQPPSFQMSMKVNDGYVKNPDLPKPIENIQIDANATNELMTLKNLEAKAGINNISGSGKLENPLKESGVFSLDLKGNVDLSTVSSFYDISQFGLEQLEGTLDLTATADGNRSKPEEASFNADVTLAGGVVKYSEVPRAITDISVDAAADQGQVTINSMSLKAGENNFSMDGAIYNPLRERKTFDMDTRLRFDLASVKEFYPIDEDTLKMEGILTAQATLKGQADRLERSIESGSINLENGFISHKSLGKPIRNITLESVLEGDNLTIVSASFMTGDNDVQASGLISGYLGDNPDIDLRLNGYAKLSEISSYYQLEPAVNELTGDANMNFRAKGQIDNPAGMQFSGNLKVSNMNMSGDSLVQPVKNLNGTLSLSTKQVSLEALNFRLGSSDISLNGSLENYMEYLKAKEERQARPHLTGSYESQYLNMDELIDWEDTTAASEPIPIHLPDLTSSVSASIGKMLVTGVNMQNLSAQATTTPEKIELEKASVNLFEGEARGSFVWNVPQPDSTTVTFEGALDSLRAESFFKEYPVLGGKSDFHRYVSGAFSADVDYFSTLDVYLEPVIETTRMEGSFGMTKARLKGHPLQNKIAAFLKTDEFRNIALDEWKSTFEVRNSVLFFRDLKLTSGDIGMEMSGTQHLVNEEIDYKMKLLLPGRFKNAVASVITKQAADALTQENGTIMVPLKITGTSTNPKVAPDEEVIKPIIKKFLKDKAGNTLKKLFGG